MAKGDSLTKLCIRVVANSGFTTPENAEKVGASIASEMLKALAAPAPPKTVSKKNPFIDTTTLPSDPEQLMQVAIMLKKQLMDRNKTITLMVDRLRKCREQRNLLKGAQNAAISDPTEPNDCVAEESFGRSEGDNGY